MNNRHRAWVYTRYPDKHGPLQFPLDRRIEYIIEGRELCPSTLATHGQGYVRFSEGVSLSSCQELLGDSSHSMHCEGRKGTEDQAVRYCKKDGCYIERGTRARQGTRKDLELAMHWIRSRVGLGQRWDFVEEQLCDEFGVLWLQYHKRFRKYYDVCVRRNGSRRLDRGPVAVSVFIGPPGTGKTRAAIEENPEAFIHNGGKWFDGYDGHDVVIFDDFDPDRISIFTMLRLLDRYRYRVERKGGFEDFNPSKIIITTNHEIDNWYPTCTDSHRAALRRRIQNIRRF